MDKIFLMNLVLEHWNTLDTVIFGQDSPKDKLNEDEYGQYLTTKGAFLMNLYEFYLKVGFETDKVFTNLEELKESSKSSYVKALNETQNMLSKNNIKKALAEEIRSKSETDGMTFNELNAHFSKEATLSMFIDNLVIREAALNSCSVCLQSWNSKIMLESYETIKNILIGFSK